MNPASEPCRPERLAFWAFLRMTCLYWIIGLSFGRLEEMPGPLSRSDGEIHEIFQAQPAHLPFAWVDAVIGGDKEIFTLSENNW